MHLYVYLFNYLLLFVICFVRHGYYTCGILFFLQEAYIIRLPLSVILAVVYNYIYPLIQIKSDILIKLLLLSILYELIL